MTSHPISLIKKITDNLEAKGYRRDRIAELFEITEQELENIYPNADCFSVDLLDDNLTITVRDNKIISAKIWSHELDADLDCTEAVRQNKRWLEMALEGKC